jgi:methyl-accepting chemotaxis protein
LSNTILSDVLDGKTVRRLKSLPDNEIGKIIQAAYEIEEERTAKEQSLAKERTQQQIIRNQSQEVNQAINQFSAKTQTITRDLDTIMGNVAESSDELLKISENVSQQTAKTNDMAFEALSSINHSQSNLHSIVDTIKAINTKSKDLTDISTVVQNETQMTSQSVDTLSKTLEQISGSSKSITDIAKKSRLLALNARIETQHQNNNGFAIIAEEVKEVSNQIQTQSQSISDISNKTVDITVKAKESITKLNNITHQTFELAKMVNDQTMHSLENAEQILALGQGTIEKVQQLVDFINVVDQGSHDTKNSTRELNEQFLKALAINRELLGLIPR